MIFKQSTTAGAVTTYLFHLALTSGGADATGKTPTVSISKAGGAFAGAAGTVTEMTAGWYKVAFTAADLGTLGALGIKITEASSVTVLDNTSQVVAYDPNDSAALGLTAVPVGSIAADAVNAAAVASDAVTKVQAGLATSVNVAAVAVPVRSASVALGTIAGASGNSSSVDLRDADACVVTVTGTFGGGTATLETCADPAAASPVWVATAHTLSSNGSITVDMPVRAVRIALSGATGASVTVTATVQRPF